MREQHGPIKEQHAFGGNGSQERQEQRFFGNYELVRRIDEGGMGEVYLARQRTAFGREVAVKIIRADLMQDVTAQKRFWREAEVSAHLKHEHILPLIEFDEDQGRLFLVTPYIDGGTLAQRLQDSPMPLAEVYLLFSALTRAVSYIHKRGVVHRDLKPSNVLLDKEEGGEQIYVRLIDFGIASIQGTAVANPQLTQSGKEVGTIEYMAPERLDGVAAPSNDIYSLGIILYQMLTGRLPNDGPPIALPSPMEYVVRHCTFTDPAQRFENADELLRVFEQAHKAIVAPKAVPITGHHVSTGDAPAKPQASNNTLDNIPRVDAAEVAMPRTTSVFKDGDYNAPTTVVDPAKFAERHKQFVAPLTGAIASRPSVPTRAKRKVGSVFAFLSFAIIAILALMSLVGYYTFLGAITATVTLSPQVHTLSQVLTITAKPTLHNTDPASASVPAYVLNSTKTGDVTGNTTGKQCILGIFDCKRVVSFADVDPLAVQLRQTLRVQVKDDLTRQSQAASATLIGTTNYIDGEPTPTPDVGAVSDTVTVTMREQGAVEYIKASDAQALARILLTQQAQQQFGAGYVLLNTATQIGQPVIQSVNANGVVTMQVPVAGVVQYQIAPKQLDALQNHIKGMKQKDARTFLVKQDGINADTLAIHVSYSDTLPADAHQIKILQVSPTNIPSVQLPPVKGAATVTTGQ